MALPAASARVVLAIMALAVKIWCWPVGGLRLVILMRQLDNTGWHPVSKIVTKPWLQGRLRYGCMLWTKLDMSQVRTYKAFLCLLQKVS